MRVRGFVVLSALIGGTVVGGCSRPATLTGQVFIVTQGRQNVVLGLVEVRAIPEKSLKGLDEKLKALLAEFDAASTSTRSCRDLFGRLGGLQQANAGGGKEAATLYEQIKSACLEGGKELAETQFGRTLDRFGKFSTGEVFLDALPVATDAVVAKTDADGRYAFNLRRGELYAIAARAERKVPGQDKPEQYFWLLWVRMDGEKKELLLSNDNQMDENPTDAVVKIPKLV